MSTEISQLSLVEKRALLAQLLQQKAGQAQTISPLSYGQRAWWFLHQLEPENAAYNIMMPLRILSEIDVEALRRALQALVERHTSLRTTYLWHEDNPAQKVRDDAELDFVEVDASTWDEQSVRSAVAEEVHRAFDLEQGPVFRAKLFTISEREHILAMTVHHIAFDLWSMMLFMHELGQLYTTEKYNEPSPLAPLKHRYTDYVRWQSKMLRGPEGDKLWAYWQRQLSGELPVLNLPTFRPRSPIQTFRGAARRFTLSPEVTTRLKALSQTQGATLYMTLLAAYQVLLSRYSGQEDVLVGSLAATGRNRAEFAGQVGFFDNQIVLRTNLSQHPTFKQVLAQVQQTVLESFEHQDYPFPLLVERLQPARDASRSPIFQAMFILQRAQLPEEVGLIGFGLGMTKASVKLGELTVEPVDYERRTASGLAGQLDLTLIAADIEGRLECSLQYNPDVFDAGIIEQMAEQFQTLLDSLIAEPERRVTSLALLSERDIERQVFEWNDTATAREFSCLHQMFEAQVEREPEAVAAIFEGEKISYRELNRRANQLAHYLQSLGVGPETRVAICFERSLEMLVAIFGVLKSGGAYVPLDPAYPKDRLAFMLEDTQAPVLLTQQKLAAQLPARETRIVCLDVDSQELARASESNPVCRTTIGNLAYIIYTSGSTGRPKGVMIDHRGAVNTILDMNKRYAVAANDRVLALSSLSFDLSVYDLFGTLAAGAAIVIPSPSPTPNPADWLELVGREQVTIWNSAPALMEVFVEYLSGTSATLPASLRVVLMSGDWISVKLPDQIRSLASRERIEVHSLGGATEASIWSITYPIEEVDSIWKSIPYGKPMVNQRFHVLDSLLQPTPVGVVGELFIGGIGVALGYHNRQELTAEKFIPDPFTRAEPGMRLYRTGDLGRYLPDGNIEFLGRIDGQVKVRGFRIELGEIETMIGQHPSVRETVVVTQTVASGEKRLVAYVVPKQEETPETGAQSEAATVELGKEELRGYLREKLPEFMVPAAFVMLDALPLTPNGKVDRGALPAPEQTTEAESEREFIAARTPTEEVLAGLWSEVLRVKRISAESNFFEVGGDSLLATQLVTRVRRAFDIELPLHCLFEAPTIAGLAVKIDDACQTSGDAASQSLQRVSRDGELPLSFSQQRVWFLDELVPGNPFCNVMAAVRFSGALNRPVLEQSLNEIIRRQESLRTTFSKVKGQPVQVIGGAWQVNIKLVDFTARAAAEQEEELQRLATEETQQPFSLAHGPLLRVVLVQLSETEHVLMLVLHHIIFDGWSFGVLLGEMSTLYKAYLNDESSPLPELTIQYADFSAWQRQWLAGEVLEEQLAYWRQQLAGSTVLELPTDRPRPEAQTFRGARHHALIQPELSAALKDLSRRHDVTFYMTLLAALKTLLYRETGVEDVLVGSPIANRTRAELDNLIGFFLNALPLRTDLSGNPAFTELLDRVRKTALGAYAHQDIPFEKLVEELRPERHLTHTPFFRIWFVFQNAPMPAMDLPGVSLSLLQVDDGTSKFDLVCTMFETEQGIHLTWIYNTDLFDSATVARFAEHYETLLQSIAAQPDGRLNALEIFTEAEREQHLLELNKRQTTNSQKLKSLRRRAVDLKQLSPTKTEYLTEGETLPLVIRPATDNVDLIGWLESNRANVETELFKHGGVLFRGFDINSPARFEQLALTMCKELFTEYGDLPQDEAHGKVYHSTPYPQDRMILYHNESSHIHLWPLKIMFYCVTPAREGGETPIVDGRKVYQLLDPALRRRFEEKRLMYVRNYKDGLDVNWRSFFGTSNRAEVERYCRNAGIEFEWRGDDLRTRKIAPAVARHPRTGDLVFFNQIQAHHVSCLEPDVRESMLMLFTEDELPRNVYYGDGTRIEDSVIDEVRAVYRQAAVVFPWSEGDILLVDNMLTGHARNPFVGPRKILVAMGDMISHVGF